jgi:hypothetical protein
MCKFSITVSEGTILPFPLEVSGFHLLHILFLQQVLILQTYPEQSHETKVQENSANGEFRNDWHTEQRVTSAHEGSSLYAPPLVCACKRKKHIIRK